MARYDDACLAVALVRRLNVNRWITEGRLPLAEAAKYGFDACLKMLLEYNPGEEVADEGEDEDSVYE